MFDYTNRHQEPDVELGVDLDDFLDEDANLPTAPTQPVFNLEEFVSGEDGNDPLVQEEPEGTHVETIMDGGGGMAREEPTRS